MEAKIEERSQAASGMMRVRNICGNEYAAVGRTTRRSQFPGRRRLRPVLF
jgi:hypothetical protein